MRVPIGAVLALLTVTAACGDDSKGTGPNHADDSRAYIDQIVPHHQIALIRADEALANATHPGLKTIAQRMKDDQSREITEFKGERSRLVGSDTTPPAMQPEPIPAGPAFDSLWITMMVTHHQGAIDMSLLARQAGVSALLDSLARHTITEQTAEQQELRDSLQAWYGGAS